MPTQDQINKRYGEAIKELAKNKETFEHLMTVLSIKLGDAREAIREDDHENPKIWDRNHKKELKLFKETSKYLKSWIEENKLEKEYTKPSIEDKVKAIDEYRVQGEITAIKTWGGRYCGYSLTEAIDSLYNRIKKYGQPKY